MSPRWARSFLELSHTSSLKRWWRLPPTTPRNQVKTSIFWKGSSRVVPSPPREVSPRSWGLALDVRDLGEPVQPPPLTCSSGSLFQRRNSYCGSHHSIIAIQQFVCAFSKRGTLGWGPACCFQSPARSFWAITVQFLDIAWSPLIPRYPWEWGNEELDGRWIEQPSSCGSRAA